MERQSHQPNLLQPSGWRPFSRLAALLMPSETSAGILRHSLLARLKNLSPRSVSYTTVWSVGLLVCLAVMIGGPRVLAQKPPGEADQSLLSVEQLRWVTTHPVIRIGIDPNWPPFSKLDEKGGFVGLDADILELLAQRTGLKFERVPTRNWEETYALAQKGEVDLLVSVAQSEERDKFLNFTKPYAAFPVVIITRKDSPFLTGIAYLQGKTIAVPRQYITTERLKKDYPNLRFVGVQTPEDALRMVADRQADAVVNNLANSGYLIKKNGLTNLKISGITPYQFDLRLGVRKDWPELVEILDRALGAIDTTQRQTIYDRWVSVEYERLILWESAVGFVLWGGLACLTIIGVVLYTNRRLAAEVRERKRAEDQAHQSREEALKARDRLADLNEEKSHLLAMAAHDLKNPLVAVQMNLGTLRHGIRADNQNALRSLEDIGRLTSRMTQRIETLLNVEELESGRKALNPAEVNPLEIAQQSVSAATPLADAKKLTLVFTQEKFPLKVFVDPNACRQILDNLLSNAIKFSPPGRKVYLTLKAHGEDCRFEVRDEGPGVRPEEMSRLFSKFSKLSARPTAGESSTGLGLSIVRHLAEAMHGRAWCESVPGQGATFVVELPGL